jgi:nicotinate-nucleotide adenylyltransferase
MEKLGLFGGSFNPIHTGHLRAAEEVREALGLDRVIFVPAADPPHKAPAELAPVAHRLAMARLATAQHKAFEVSDFEAARPEKSYSIFTIQHFRETAAAGSALFFLVGADAFAEIATWRRWREALAAAIFVVMTRPGSRVAKPADALPADFAARYKKQATGVYATPAGARLLFQPVTGLDIASSDIRRRLAEGRSIRYLVPNTVAHYIAAHRLYVSDQ